MSIIPIRVLARAIRRQKSKKHYFFLHKSVFTTPPEHGSFRVNVHARSLISCGKLVDSSSVMTPKPTMLPWEQPNHVDNLPIQLAIFPSRTMAPDFWRYQHANNHLSSMPAGFEWGGISRHLSASDVTASLAAPNRPSPCLVFMFSVELYRLLLEPR